MCVATAPPVRYQDGGEDTERRIGEQRGDWLKVDEAQR
jgi:hypothetical protein